MKRSVLLALLGLVEANAINAVSVQTPNTPAAPAQAHNSTAEVIKVDASKASTSLEHIQTSKGDENAQLDA